MARNSFEDKLPFSELATLGLDLSSLQNWKNFWDPFIHGERTPMIQVKIVSKWGKSYPMWTKLQLYESKRDNQVGLLVHSIDPRLDLDKGIGEYNFDEKEKERLTQYAELGKEVTLTFGTKKIECLVGVDTELRKVFCVPTAAVFINEKIRNVKLKPDEQEKIKRGFWAFKEKVTHYNQDGSTYEKDSIISYSAGFRKILITEATPEIMAELKIRNQEYKDFVQSRKEKSENQKQDFSENKEVKPEDLVSYELANRLEQEQEKSAKRKTHGMGK